MDEEKELEQGVEGEAAEGEVEETSDEAETEE